VRYAFVRDHQREFPVKALCRVLEVPRSGFYAWRRGTESRRERSDRRLLVEIRELHHRSGRAYGSPRITKGLRVLGHLVNHKRVERLMAAEGLRSVHRRKYRVTTDSSHGKAVAPNILDRRFAASGPNQKWVADITYVWTERDGFTWRR
jgi:transposase InsO family protein